MRLGSRRQDLRGPGDCAGRNDFKFNRRRARARCAGNSIPHDCRSSVQLMAVPVSSWTLSLVRPGPAVPADASTGFRQNSAAQRIDQLQSRKSREVAIAGGEGSTVFKGECCQVGL